MRIGLIMLLLFCGSLVYGQETDGIDTFIPTENIKKQSSKRKKNSPKRKKIPVIVKNDAYGILYGNPCMFEETYKMGFEYAVQTPGIPGSLTGMKKFWNNLQAWGKLTFTRGPFWKISLNKRVRDCRLQSGDFVG